MNKAFVVALIVLAELTVLSLQSVCASYLSFETILAKPIIEGQEAAGIKLGDSEARVTALMSGLPNNVENSGEDTKILSYGNMTDEGGSGINIFTKDGVVIGIEIVSHPRMSKGHLYTGKTKKGFSFGDSIARISALYGKAYKTFRNRIFWYRRDGIIFEYLGWENETGGEIVPNAVVVIAPGSDIIPHLRKRGGYE